MGVYFLNIFIEKTHEKDFYFIWGCVIDSLYEIMPDAWKGDFKKTGVRFFYIRSKRLQRDKIGVIRISA